MTWRIFCFSSICDMKCGRCSIHSKDCIAFNYYYKNSVNIEKKNRFVCHEKIHEKWFQKNTCSLICFVFTTFFQWSYIEERWSSVLTQWTHYCDFVVNFFFLCALPTVRQSANDYRPTFTRRQFYTVLSHNDLAVGHWLQEIQSSTVGLAGRIAEKCFEKEFGEESSDKEIMKIDGVRLYRTFILKHTTYKYGRVHVQHMRYHFPCHCNGNKSCTWDLLLIAYVCFRSSWIVVIIDRSDEKGAPANFSAEISISHALTYIFFRVKFCPDHFHWHFHASHNLFN